MTVGAKWRLAAAAGLMLLLAAVTAAGLLLPDERTASAQGVITRVELDEAVGDQDSDETEVTFTFAPAGRSVESTQSFPNDQRRVYRPGQAVHVCYKPERPTNAHITPADYQCGS